MVSSSVAAPRSVVCCFILVVSLIAVVADAWSVGDVVPMQSWIRVNGTLPKSPSAIPLDFCPRFARAKVVQIPSLDFSSHEVDVAIKFEVGRGLNKHTKWMALKQKPTSSNYIKAEKHLTMVVFDLGTKWGRLVDSRPSKRPHETITIHYEWDEHRMYNPHLALGLVSAVALFLMVFLMHRISTDTLFRS
eukprot:CAMPEP_0176446754 /NCGR_PEP_ID=MMETSP0127-20121128/24526_1 /TAXON_ID=938130 /ORGANISM="Platyophrya macrostoma, Strain WH" /LENGTH=189 /DNA_ID=CAMNT_0017832873 /DNA_START=44 /DNA_END=610 /DNA_ORIENTATION=-